MYNNNGFCGNSCLWIIILLILFCGCGNNGFCGIGGGYGGGNNCGNNCGCGNGCGCDNGCGCC